MIADIEQLAAAEFRPVEPGHQQKMKEAIRFHGDILILAFACLNKSRDDLIKMWMTDDLDEANRQFVAQLRSTQEWLRDIIKPPEVAEIRMMAACAASTKEPNE